MVELWLLVALGACGVLAGRRPVRARGFVVETVDGRERVGDWRWWVGGLVVAALVLGSPVVVVVAVLGGGFVRRELGRRAARRAVADRGDAVLEFVVGVGAGLRAGRSLGVAVLESGGGAERANAVGVGVAGQLQAGRPLVQAVEEVLGSGVADERLVATTMWALDGSGAPAGDALERVADALRERRSSREDARTQAQQALSSASVLSVLPLVFGVVAALVEPDVARLYGSTWVGAGCVGVAGSLSFAGWEWLQRLLEAV